MSMCGNTNMHLYFCTFGYASKSLPPWWQTSAWHRTPMQLRTHYVHICLGICMAPVHCTTRGENAAKPAHFILRLWHIFTYMYMCTSQQPVSEVCKYFQIYEWTFHNFHKCSSSHKLMVCIEEIILFSFSEYCKSRV